jgi:ectoine hydroxylase-related dioxygenase (phytanoyl-CoA dioxygenase family)
MENQLQTNGFEIIESVYTKQEIDEILDILSFNNVENKFGIREFLMDNSEIINKVFTERLLKIIKVISPNCNQSIKSIYFDKPPNANWIVNWHQDLTINLKAKKETPNFKNWRVNRERTIVQPSVEILENIFTIRIHLDGCTKENGALRVIEKSHNQGVIEIVDWLKNQEGIEKICEVKQGGILIMKPLILHASKRTENQQNRRVIHIEFCDMDLPNGLEWKEKLNFKNLITWKQQILIN